MQLPRIDGRAARWDEHRAERRRHVLDAAVKVIEESPPGAEINVQQIADAAGLVRTVVYRHFDGRAELQRAVQAHIAAQMLDSTLSGLTVEGSIEKIIERTITGFVDWVAQHPNLYLAAERELGDGQESQLLQTVNQVADRISSTILFIGQMLGRAFTEDEQAALSTIVFGVIGQVRGTMGHWIRRTPRKPEAQVVAKMLCRSIWIQIDAQARVLGLEIDPTVPLKKLLADAAE